MRRAAVTLIAALLGYVLIEAAVFHSGFWLTLLSPDSTTNHVEATLRDERERPRDSPNQVLAIGDSRMALQPRVANQLTPETGYTFASIGVAGTTPRDWYYMLRDVDPHANRYRAIVITMDTFDDEDTGEDLANRELDLYYMVGRLRLGDIRDFAGSFLTREGQFRAARGLLIKGLTLKKDVQDFLLHPRERLELAEAVRRHNFEWNYGYEDQQPSLAGLSVDWEHKKLTAGPQTPPDKLEGLNRRLFTPFRTSNAEQSRYLKHWLGRIYEHYRGSSTRIIFVRVPRMPWIRPDMQPRMEDSSVRQLAKQPEVIMLSEHLFDYLEHPESFKDELHLTQHGINQFATQMAREVRTALGPPL